MQAWQRALIATALLLALSRVTGVLDALNRRISDTHWTWLAAARPEPFPSDILVVAIDDRTLAKLGRPGTWSRRRYADLLSRLGAARAVGLDILFPEPGVDPGGDLAFARAVKAHGRVVLPYHQWHEARTITRESNQRTHLLLERLPRAPEWVMRSAPPVVLDTLEPPLTPLLLAARSLGYADVSADPDGVYRSAQLVKPSTEGAALVHFTVALAALASGRELLDALAAGPSLSFGGHRVTLKDGTLLLHPIARRGGGHQAGPGQPVPQISFVEALKADPAQFRDKIVLVGETAAGTTDVRPNPLDNGLRGVEFNAEVLANLLHLRPVGPLSLPFQWLLILATGGVPLWLFASYSPRAASLGSLALLGLAMGSMDGAFWLAGLIPRWATVLVALIGSTLGMGVQCAVREHAQKQKIRERFGQYVPPKLVEQIARNPEMAIEAGRRQHVAVLFSDVRDFTPYSERNPPELVERQMSEYLDEMAAVVAEQGGLLDKFIGDAVMALYGPFLAPEANLAARAVASGLDMLDRLEAINERWAAQGLPLFRIGIGVHSGEAMVGNFGTPRRHQFTALGDTVNLAARLESATKEVGATLLVTDAARAEAEPVLGRFVQFLDRGEIRVKGREQPVRVFEACRRTAPADAPAPAAYEQREHEDAGQTR